MYFSFDGEMEIPACLVFKEKGEASILVLKLKQNICLFGQIFCYICKHCPIFKSLLV